ncbi:hypothetical protein TUBRATIS_25720 [Tubulinosema ratisbonensis]|uniref:Uncharacterized protein n=1 Tax=Tubulinosema ratisbonensis TaxID=291195 RepID=A0A437AII1_9MICR|nr:hypothetical protein TUBRATIS_25720 [Tubulinosema ratisbonensis]
MGEKYFYIIFCIICIMEAILYMVYAKISIHNDFKRGIRMSPESFYGIIGYFFSTWLKFISLSHTILSKDLLSLLLYFFTYFNILFYTLATFFLATEPYLFLGFICSLILEIFFVIYCYDYSIRKTIYCYNIKIGSNLQLKRALNVSIN